MNYSEIIHGDCLEILRKFPENHFDSVVTDPPYELSFMGKKWDASGIAYNTDVWAECLRVLKPGGHLLAFGGTRTYHRMTVAIEDAGFEIRDSLHWIYGSGFPKSLDVSKAIDKAAGAEREVIGKSARHVSGKDNQRTEGLTGSSTFAESIGMGSQLTAPATNDAKQWEGWGTALKPAHEPIVLARKPLAAKTVAMNVIEFGTGGLNIDACRIGFRSEADKSSAKPGGVSTSLSGALAGKVQACTTPKDSSTTAETMGISVNPESTELAENAGGIQRKEFTSTQSSQGRWPPNILLSGEAAQEMDTQTGMLTSGTGAVKRATGKGGPRSASIGAESRSAGTPNIEYGDTGGASRFFPCFRYQAKAPKSERPKGEVSHPTVKPLSLMRWLVKLVTPSGGIVLDPFAGSGTTGEACHLEGMKYVLIEREADYIRLINARLAQGSLFEEVERIEDELF